MSRSQMADVLNLPVRTIAAIEENNRGASAGCGLREWLHALVFEAARACISAAH